MTGFTGLVAARGAPIDPALSQKMAAAIARLGPDRRDSWQGAGVFLAHAMLATTEEEVADRQPLSFDGAVHLVADARIDGREALIDALRAAGREARLDAPDSHLILHAWHVWGEACVERLIGDFAFAIWDARTRRLFCARDQFGSVPFYYARVGETFLFANAVPALLAHPGLDRSLDRRAIGDYLLLGYALDRDAGSYRAIRRLPPAHCMTVTEGEVRLRRYWQLPEADFAEAERLPPDDLTEWFGTVFDAAVRDRLRSPRIATTLSGGMDSTMIAAAAKREGAGRSEIHAWSYGSDWLMPDRERPLAQRCAEHLGISFNPVSVERIYTDPPRGVFRAPPEPRMELRTSSFHLVGEELVDRDIRVLLLGMGGDAIVGGGVTHWVTLVRQRRYARLMRETIHFWRHHRRRPPFKSVLARLRATGARPIAGMIDPGLIAEERMDERWRDLCASQLGDPREGMANHPFWTELLVAAHPESTGLPLRVRQPMFDVRLIEAAMRVPPMPWQFDKAILRRRAQGLLPSEIVARPKTVFGVNGSWEAARRGLEPWLAALAQAEVLEGYVDRPRLTAILASLETLPPHRYSSQVMLPAGLAAWLGADLGPGGTVWRA